MKLGLTVVTATLWALVCGNEYEFNFKNANYIFNEIHSSARQFGSSLNHNGMAFFLATVGAGVEFYHGSSSADPVRGMEW